MPPVEHRPRVLVVDDEPLVLELLETTLGLAGYDVVTAGDGVQALEQIRAASPDAVVLDINMPRLDGFGVLAALSAEAFPDPPRVLVLTARHASADVAKAISMGAVDYLSKPFKESVLLARVARMTRRRSLAGLHA
jgi:DNA-binding response OmpR family regulator